MLSVLLALFGEIYFPKEAVCLEFATNHGQITLHSTPECPSLFQDLTLPDPRSDPLRTLESMLQKQNPQGDVWLSSPTSLEGPFYTLR